MMRMMMAGLMLMISMTILMIMMLMGDDNDNYDDGDANDADDDGDDADFQKSRFADKSDSNTLVGNQKIRSRSVCLARRRNA